MTDTNSIYVCITTVQELKKETNVKKFGGLQGFQIFSQ